MQRSRPRLAAWPALPTVRPLLNKEAAWCSVVSAANNLYCVHNHLLCVSEDFFLLLLFYFLLSSISSTYTELVYLLPVSLSFRFILHLFLLCFHLAKILFLKKSNVTKERITLSSYRWSFGKSKKPGKKRWSTLIMKMWGRRRRERWKEYERFTEKLKSEVDIKTDERLQPLLLAIS